MERKGLMNTTNNNNIMKTQMMKEYYWECKSEMRCGIGGGDEYMNVMWPPRPYICSFCKREFRSAQALGGHMNVHRRDRAMLRQQTPPPPPTTILNLNLSPTPSPPSSTIMLKKPLSNTPTTLPSFLPSNNTPSPSSYNVLMKQLVVDGIVLNPSSTKVTAEYPENMMMKNNATSLSMGFGGHSNDNDVPFAQEQVGSKAVKRADDIIRLDLRIGLLSDSSKDGLDLELRLGTHS